MKFLAIALALAIFTGSPASVSSEESASRLEQIKRNLQECWTRSSSPLRCLPSLYSNSEFLQNVSRHFDHQGDLLSQSDVLQAVQKQAHASMQNITRRFVELGRDMPSEVKETLDMTLVIPTGLAAKLLSAVQDFSKKMEPATREFYNAMEPVVGPHAQKAVEHARPYASVFHRRIQEMGKNQTERLKLRLQELESLGPQIKNVLGYLQEIQVALQPLADELQEIVRQRAENAASLVRPYVKPALDAAKTYTSEVKKWAPSPFFASSEQ